jgi:hypothetical protein
MGAHTRIAKEFKCKCGDIEKIDVSEDEPNTRAVRDIRALLAVHYSKYRFKPIVNGLGVYQLSALCRVYPKSAPRCHHLK